MLPVVHFFTGPQSKDALSMPNSRLPTQQSEWVRWLYKTDAPNAKLWFDVGRTQVFQEHVNATLAFNASECPTRQPTRCRWLFPSVARLAREANLTSIQFTSHTMDRFRPRPRYEIVDLQRPWRQWYDGQELRPPYYASEDGAPCAALRLNVTSRRAECSTRNRP